MAFQVFTTCVGGSTSPSSYSRNQGERTPAATSITTTNAITLTVTPMTIVESGSFSFGHRPSLRRVHAQADQLALVDEARSGEAVGGKADFFAQADPGPAL